jgi:PAS domain S-box-containing protein
MESMEKLFMGNEDFVRSVLNSSNSGILVVDREGIIVFVNTTGKKILNTNKKKLEGKHFSSINKSGWKAFRKIMDTGEPELGKKFKIYDQSIISSRTPIKRDGKNIGVLSIFQEISAVEKIMPELSSYQNMLKTMDAVFESSYDGLYVTDGEANTLRVNSSWEKITGLRAKDVVGRNMVDLEREGYFSRTATLMVLREKKPVSTQLRVPSGRQILASGNPVFDDEGNITMVVNNVRDLTEMRKLSSQLEESKELAGQYQNKIEKLKAHLFEHEDIIGESRQMKEVLDLAKRVACADIPVLITGETGVGKEVVAKFIHENSNRSSDGLFLEVNCGAIPENLLETELFGYEGGAFTGANRSGKSGLLETAEGRTIVLDEIGELSLSLQVKLLRALQDFEITPVGGRKTKKINVRLISITNRDLEKMVEEGAFREDLYFRINVVPIEIPPLRERREDILYLLNFHLQKFNRKHGENAYFNRNVIDRLIYYDWPGNVRELGNIVERLVVVTPHEEIEISDLPDTLCQKFPGFPVAWDVPLKKAVNQYEVTLIKNAIDRYGSAQHAASYLKVDPATIYRKLKTAKLQIV